MRRRRSARPAHARRRVWAFALLALAAWAVAATFFVATAAGDAREAKQVLTAVRDRYAAADLLTGDARAEIDAARARFGRAADRAGSPILAPARVLPFVGRQLQSLRALSAAGEDVLSSALAVSATLEATADQDPGPAGRVAAAAEVREVVGRATGELQAVDLGPSQALVSPLADAREVLEEELTDAIDAGVRATAIAAGMEQLLRGGRYVVLASNNAEMQAGWGMPLSVGLLEVSDGELILREMSSTGSVIVPPGAVAVTGDLERHWPFANATSDWRNLALTPHFADAAELAAEMWQAIDGRPVDGVLVLDPFALQAVLAATGPVQADGREVSAEDVVQYSLHDSYVEQDLAGAGGRDDRRERQSAIAVAVVEAIGRPEIDLLQLFTNLAEAGAGRHLLLWSSDDLQQAAWTAAGVDGSLHEDSLLLTLVNRGGNKLDWFIDVEVDVSSTATADGIDVVLEVTVHNRTPTGEPRYIAGPTAGTGLDAGDWGGHLGVYLPAAAANAFVDGVPGVLAIGPSGPTTLIAAPVTVRRGESSTYAVRFDLPAGAGTVDVEPSGRVRPVAWVHGNERWQDRSGRTLSLGGDSTPR